MSAAPANPMTTPHQPVALQALAEQGRRQQRREDRRDVDEQARGRGRDRDLAGVEEHLVGGHTAQRAQRQQREVAARRPADPADGGHRTEDERPATGAGRRCAQPRARTASRMAAKAEAHNTTVVARAAGAAIRCTRVTVSTMARDVSRPFTNFYRERKLSFVMLDVRRLHMLRELSERGTVAATAEALGYSAPAVSQHLAALKRQVGVALLERQGRRVVLTSAARLLVGRTERVLAELEAAEAELAAGNGDVRGSVHLAAFPTAAATLVPRAMATFAARHPRAEILLSELEPEAALPALKLGEADPSAVIHEYDFSPRGEDPSVELTPLAQDEIHVAVPAGHRAAGGEDRAERAGRRALDRRLPRHGVPPRGRHRLSRRRLRAADRGALQRLPRRAGAGRRRPGRRARPRARGRGGA